VATRRVMRGRSMPPAPVAHYTRTVAPVAHYARTEVPVAFARASPNTLRYSVPPASAPISRSRYPRVVVRPRYRNFVPVRSSRGQASADIEGQRRAPLSLLAYLRNLDTVLKIKRYRPRSTYVPVRSALQVKNGLLMH